MGSVTCAVEEEGKGKQEKTTKGREGQELLGSPTFQQLENGRFKCVETGHEMPAKEKESYSRSKRCRVGLIDSALSQKKPPLSMFKQDPANRMKLICKLTGDTINKSEEHIWKHINGSKFLSKLEKMESGTLAPDGMEVEEKNEMKSHKGSKLSAKGVKKDKKNGIGKGVLTETKLTDGGSDFEEPEFWSPPMGSRWDFDDGGDRWGSGTDSGEESEDGNGIDEVDDETALESSKLEVDDMSALESEELAKGTKRMSIEAVGPSSFASRKKKSKTNSTGDPTSN